MTKELTITSDLQLALDKRNVSYEQFKIIKEILYPNVQKDETLIMALDYCKARNLDIMKKSIQIVPIYDSKTGCMKDTIWTSISEVRITATRTGTYAGRSEAEFGEDVTENLGGITVTYPKWCKVTVWRMVKGEKCSFTAKLLWKEEYKTAKKDTLAPNSMWSKRNYAQLEKCTEAAALRMAFPEELGNDYIAEETFDTIKNITPAPSAKLDQFKPPQTVEEGLTEEQKLATKIVEEAKNCKSTIEVDNLAKKYKNHVLAFSELTREQVKGHFNYIRSGLETINPDTGEVV